MASAVLFFRTKKPFRANLLNDVFFVYVIVTRILLFNSGIACWGEGCLDQNFNSSVRVLASATKYMLLFNIYRREVLR